MLDQPKPGAGQPCPSACAAVAQVPADLGRDDLNGLLILRHVCLDDVWGLLASCSVRCLEPGDVLLAAGQPNDTLYMVLEGRLRVHLHAESEPVAFIEAGQTVGEMSVIDGSPASAHVMAASTSRLLAVDEETFWRMIAASHNFASNLLVLLARRMRANNSSLSASAEIRGELERQATVDGLTGLFNRRFLGGADSG